MSSKNPNPIGFPNIGNTCYLNSITQALSHTVEFVLTINKIDTDDNDEITLLDILKYIFSIVWNNNSKKDIHKTFVLYKNNLSQKNNIFKHHTQEDASDAYIYIIDILNDILKQSIIIEEGELEKKQLKDKQDIIHLESQKSWNSFIKNNYSQLIDIFYGQFKNISFNKYNNEISINFEPFNYISLPIPNNKKYIDIYDCFDKYTEQEDINDKIIKKITFYQLPNILVIGFNRFNNGLQKSNAFIEYPIILDLEKYTTNPFISTHKYELYSVINHYGNIHGGHYTNYSKKRGVWFEYNDEEINEIEESNLIHKNAYVLFYKKKFN